MLLRSRHRLPACQICVNSKLKVAIRICDLAILMNISRTCRFVSHPIRSVIYKVYMYIYMNVSWSQCQISWLTQQKRNFWCDIQFTWVWASHSTNHRVDVISSILQRMRETPVSSCEKNFLLEVAKNGKIDLFTAVIFLARLCGRDEDWTAGDGWIPETCQSALGRIGDPVRLSSFSKNPSFNNGEQVTLGKTRVLAQVSATVTEPRLSRCHSKNFVLAPISYKMPPRPNEGVLLVNVELSPIAAPKFEAGRMSDEGVEINRFEYWWTLVALSISPQNPWTVFERESVSWSGESLHHIWGKGLPCRLNWFKRTRHSTAMCKVKISYQVWTVRLDLHVLCHEGSLADACSVAGLAALSHFRRPDVTLKVFLLLPPVNHNLWRTNRETWWLCIQLMSGTQYLWLSTTILSLPPLQCFRCEIKFSSLSLS